MVNYRKDGTPYDVELFITPSLAPEGRRASFVSIHRDVTERKDLQKHVLQAGVEEQRKIGQELHDGIGQELTGLTLVAGALVERLEGKSSSAGEPRANSLQQERELSRLRKIALRLKQGLADANRHVHQLSHGIVPVQVDSEGLASALIELAATTESAANVSCRFESSGPAAVADNVSATHLFRIAQEALNNALRHGRADQIRISLSYQNGQSVLEVSDNGCGFDPVAKSHATGTGAGMGLRTMQYRAGILGGTLQIESRRDEGTRIRCAIPGER
jgi:two-component system CheB/CheR fusion protein